jgi:hypothetical protein
MTAQVAYEYDNSAVPVDEKKVGGQRLVGAAAAAHSNIPFVVSWNSHAGEGPEVSECTGWVRLVIGVDRDR